MAEFITFFFGAAVVLAGAIGVVVARNAVHSALFLIQHPKKHLALYDKLLPKFRKYIF